jgi:hypothetical protein
MGKEGISEYFCPYCNTELKEDNLQQIDDLFKRLICVNNQCTYKNYYPDINFSLEIPYLFHSNTTPSNKRKYQTDLKHAINDYDYRFQAIIENESSFKKAYEQKFYPDLFQKRLEKLSNSFHQKMLREIESTPYHRLLEFVSMLKMLFLSDPVIIGLRLANQKVNEKPFILSISLKDIDAYNDLLSSIYQRSVFLKITKERKKVTKKVFKDGKNVEEEVEEEIEQKTISQLSTNYFFECIHDLNLANEEYRKQVSELQMVMPLGIMRIKTFSLFKVKDKNDNDFFLEFLLPYSTEELGIINFEAQLNKIIKNDTYKKYFNTKNLTENPVISVRAVEERKEVKKLLNKIQDKFSNHGFQPNNIWISIPEKKDTLKFLCPKKKENDIHDEMKQKKEKKDITTHCDNIKKAHLPVAGLIGSIYNTKIPEFVISSRSDPRNACLLLSSENKDEIVKFFKAETFFNGSPLFFAYFPLVIHDVCIGVAAISSKYQRKENNFDLNDIFEQFLEIQSIVDGLKEKLEFGLLLDFLSFSKESLFSGKKGEEEINKIAKEIPCLPGIDFFENREALREKIPDEKILDSRIDIAKAEYQEFKEKYTQEQEKQIETKDKDETHAEKDFHDNYFKYKEETPTYRLAKIGENKWLVLSFKHSLEQISTNIDYVCDTFIRYARIAFTENELKRQLAVSSIVSYNFAHNIGSHVLFWIEKDIKDFPDKLDSKEMEYFCNYIRERGSFQANLTGSSIVHPLPGSHMVCTGGFFRSMDDTIKQISENRLSWRNILRSELQKEINIHFEIKGKKDQSIWWPGGIIAEHAFYSVLENIIRNIKHWLNLKNYLNNWNAAYREIYYKKNEDINNNNSITVTIDVLEPDRSVSVQDSFVKVIVSDNLPVHRKIIEERKRDMEGINIIDTKKQQPDRRGSTELFIEGLLLRGVSPIIDYAEVTPPSVGIEYDEKAEIGSIKYTFYMWKGDYIKVIQNSDEWDIIQKGQDNPYRFKYVVIRDEVARQDENLQPENIKGRMGIMVEDNINAWQNRVWTPANKELADEFQACQSWVAWWLGINIKDFKLEEKMEKLPGEGLKIKGKSRDYRFVHGQGWKSYGNDIIIPVTFKYEFGKNLKKFLSDFENIKIDEKKKYYFELLETLETKIKIIDERIYSILKSLNPCIKLINFEIQADIDDLDELKKDFVEILILHSSNIEKYFRDKGDKIIEELKNFNCREMVITSGKADPSWLKSLSIDKRVVFIQVDILKEWILKAMKEEPEPDRSMAYVVKSRLIEGILNWH